MKMNNQIRQPAGLVVHLHQVTDTVPPSTNGENE
jgi:hypothetical protein